MAADIWAARTAAEAALLSLETVGLVQICRVLTDSKKSVRKFQRLLKVVKCGQGIGGETMAHLCD